MGSATPQFQTVPAACAPLGRLGDEALAQGASRLQGFAPVQAAITGRCNVSPKRLVAPGPSMQQLEALLALAAAAPDHGHLLPWRFVLIPQAQRQRLGDAFVSALIGRDPGATQEQIASAAEKAQRAPVLLLAVACSGHTDSGIPEVEQLVSLGAAIQNLLLGATALGFGSGLTSGQAMDTAPLRALFQLGAGESAVCFVNIGTVSAHKASKRMRPGVETLLSTLGQ